MAARPPRRRARLTALAEPALDVRLRQQAEQPMGEEGYGGVELGGQAPRVRRPLLPSLQAHEGLQRADCPPATTRVSTARKRPGYTVMQL